MAPAGPVPVPLAVATREVNQSVKRVLEKQQSQQKPMKKKDHSHYSNADWHRIETLQGRKIKI